jgi:hypothetical protein
MLIADPDPAVLSGRPPAAFFHIRSTRFKRVS